LAVPPSNLGPYAPNLLRVVVEEQLFFFLQGDPLDRTEFSTVMLAQDLAYGFLDNPAGGMPLTGLPSSSEGSV
jgi:hypothetical protein